MDHYALVAAAIVRSPRDTIPSPGTTYETLKQHSSAGNQLTQSSFSKSSLHSLFSVVVSMKASRRPSGRRQPVSYASTTATSRPTKLASKAIKQNYESNVRTASKCRNQSISGHIQLQVTAAYIKTNQAPSIPG